MDKYAALGGRFDMAQVNGWYERFMDVLRARGGDWGVWYPGQAAEGHGPLGSAIAAAMARDA